MYDFPAPEEVDVYIRLLEALQHLSDYASRVGYGDEAKRSRLEEQVAPIIAELRERTERLIDAAVHKDVDLPVVAEALQTALAASEIVHFWYLPNCTSDRERAIHLVGDLKRRIRHARCAQPAVLAPQANHSGNYLTPAQIISRLPLAGLDDRQKRYQVDKIRALPWVRLNEKGHLLAEDFDTVFAMLRRTSASKRNVAGAIAGLPKDPTPQEIEAAKQQILAERRQGQRRAG